MTQLLRVSQTEVKEDLQGVIDVTNVTGAQYLITRQGNPVAVLMSYETYGGMRKVIEGVEEALERIFGKEE